METDIVQEKRNLRKKMRRMRDSISVSDKSIWDRQIREAFLAGPELQKASVICLYISCGSEVDTRALIPELVACGKRIAAPRVEGDQIRFYEISGLEDTVPGYRGIPEPGAHCPPPEEAADALVVVPGLAFTRDGKRMGYGGGFYDRFLEAHPQYPTIAFSYHFQILEDIPADSRDCRIGTIITSAAGGQ